MLARIQLRQLHAVDDPGPCPVSVRCSAHGNTEADPPARLRLVKAKGDRVRRWVGRRLVSPGRGSGDLGPGECEACEREENKCRASSGSLGGGSGEHMTMVVVAGSSDQPPKG